MRTILQAGRAAVRPGELPEGSLQLELVRQLDLAQPRRVDWLVGSLLNRTNPLVCCNHVAVDITSLL